MTTQRIHATPRGSSRGFTLLELMIVLAVLGILSAIAYPGYQEYARRGRRGEARAALLELRQQQERYMTQFNTYMAFDETTANAPFTKKVGSNPSNPSYKLSATACPAATGATSAPTLQSCIKLIATPVVTDAKVGNLSITSLGEKDCTGNAKSTNFKLCWP